MIGTRFIQDMLLKITAKIKFNSLIILVLAMFSMLAFSGCSNSSNIIEKPSNNIYDDFDGVAYKTNGEPFTIAIMDEGPPIESSYLWFKGLCENLQKMGYISESVDLTSMPQDLEGYYQKLLSEDLGNINFYKELFLVDGSETDAYAGNIYKAVNAGEIDIFIVTGTLPGKYVKSLNLNIPLMVSFASDPVASGIIDSVEDTGNENIWALVEPAPFARQLDIYQDMFKFNKLGVITTDEYDDVAGGPDTMKEADKLNIEIIKKTLHVGTSDDSKNNKANAEIKEIAKELLDESVDAVLVLYGPFESVSVTPYDISDILAEKKIPLLISDGTDNVRNGGLILISMFDYEGYGNYVAYLAGKVFNGEKAGSLPTEYISTPKIMYNIDTASRLSIKPEYNFARTVDEFFGATIK